MRYSELFSVKKFLLLLVVSVVSIYVGIGFGSAISSFGDSGTKLSSTNNSLKNEGSSAQGNLWIGTIRKITPFDVDVEGGFKLVNESEKIVAILQSARIDLSMLEGMNATIEGRRVRNLKSDLPLILVDKVKFK